MTADAGTRLKVSPRVAEIVRGTDRGERLRAARGELPLATEELLTVTAFLIQGGDDELRSESIRTLKRLPHSSLLPLLGDPQLHPKLIDLIERVRAADAVLMAALAANPSTDAKTLARLALRAEGDLLRDIASGERAAEPPVADALRSNPHAARNEEAEEADNAEDAQTEQAPAEDEEIDPSKYRQALQMEVAQKIKTAMTGDKEWRSILLKDTNKLVSAAALKNPRITEAEVLAIAKNKSSHDELIRLITLNPEWVKNYEIQKALVVHPRTPLPKALRFMNVLTPKDLKHLAKSRGVNQVVVNQARRLLLVKDKSR